MSCAAPITSSPSRIHNVLFRGTKRAVVYECNASNIELKSIRMSIEIINWTCLCSICLWQSVEWNLKMGCKQCNSLVLWCTKAWPVSSTSSGCVDLCADIIGLRFVRALKHNTIISVSLSLSVCHSICALCMHIFVCIAHKIVHLLHLRGCFHSIFFIFNVV